MDYEHFGHRTHCGGISSVIVYLILFSTVPFEKEEDWTPKSPIWISYIENRELEKRFNEKKAEFKKQGLHSEIFLYHGTSSANTGGICETNFRMDLSSRFAHGRGIYLSRQPTCSLMYGEELIVCKVLLGRKQGQFTDPGPLKDGFDSTEVDRYWKGHWNAIVIRSVDQILPYCIISAEYPEAVKVGACKGKPQHPWYTKIWNGIRGK